jgi:hypothetical protein
MSTIYFFCDQWEPLNTPDPCYDFIVTDTDTDNGTWNTEWEVEWNCTNHERYAERYTSLTQYDRRVAQFRATAAAGQPEPTPPTPEPTPPTQHTTCQACGLIVPDPFGHLLINQACFAWMNAITTTRRWGNFLPRTLHDTPDWVTWRDVCSAWNTPSRSGHPNPRTHTQEDSIIPTFRSTWAP